MSFLDSTRCTPICKCTGLDKAGECLNYGKSCLAQGCSTRERGLIQQDPFVLRMILFEMVTQSDKMTHLQTLLVLYGFSGQTTSESTGLNYIVKSAEQLFGVWDYKISSTFALAYYCTCAYGNKQ